MLHHKNVTEFLDLKLRVQPQTLGTELQTVLS